MPNISAIPPELLEIASTVLPSADFDGARMAMGQFNDVVLLPQVAAVRIPRSASAALELPRQLDLLRRLSQAGLPFTIPEPLTAVVQVGHRVAAAVSWIPGSPRAEGDGDPRQFSRLLSALRRVRLETLADLLNKPNAYAGQEAWFNLMLTEAIPRLPAAMQADARSRAERAAALEAVPDCLVHGDLGGDNLHWDAAGELVGVLDWDLAQPFDQAVDVACLAFHGWHNVAPAVEPETLQRAPDLVANIPPSADHRRDHLW